VAGLRPLALPTDVRGERPREEAIHPKPENRQTTFAAQRE
ncbi:hypothetical protein THOM_1471, partial [Trachipleistophora hominis]